MKEDLKRFAIIFLAYLAIAVMYYEFEKWMYRKMFRQFNKKYANNNNGQSMSIKRACEILGIKPEDLKKMSKDDLKKAYRKAAMKTHPDRNGNDGEAFKDVNNAWSYMKEAGYAAA